MRTDGERETTGILLLNLGGPDSLKAVRPFLFNLFSDREIIRLGPSIMQKPIACLIAAARGGKTRDCYKLIGGKSPIFEITSAQARTLEGALNSGSGVGVQRLDTEASRVTVHASRQFRVYIAMRYWHPFIGQVMPKINEDGIRKLIVLSLYPQYSIATTGSSVSMLMKAAARYPVEMVTIPSWFDNPLYIDSVVEKIKDGMRQMPDARILFSAHSLPVKFIEEGDPYLEHIKGTIGEIMKRIDIPWDLSFQSKSGPVKWLEPSTEKMIHDFARRGVKNVLAVPISFVSDHIETLYEIDILYRNMAASLGIRLERTESLNTSPLFISAMEDIILKTLKEAGWA